MAKYADNDKKMVAVLNKQKSVPQLLNALGHMAAGLPSLVADMSELRFLHYQDADGGAHPAISHYPFIVLRAENSNQIRKLRCAALEAGLVYNDFVESMLGESAEDQLQKTARTPEANLEYIGILLFGSAETLNALTKRFSLFRESTSTGTPPPVAREEKQP